VIDICIRFESTELLKFEVTALVLGLTNRKSGKAVRG
jgi:hypothetical protein